MLGIIHGVASYFFANLVYTNAFIFLMLIVVQIERIIITWPHGDTKFLFKC